MMKSQRIGYIRVGNLDQHPEQQLAQVSVDRVFTDRASCNDVQRPARDQALAFVRAGDTLVVQRMDRLARNLDELCRLVQHLTQRGVYRGRKQTLSPAQAAELRRRVEIGESKTVLAREFGISRETLYQYLKRTE
jgi:DNA invertase Pin-like site-specific DNA recombinase